MIDVDKVQKIFNILICWHLQVEVINPGKHLFLVMNMYKVRKQELYLKERNTKWLSFNLKSFPHLHQNRLNTGLQGSIV